MTKKSLVEVLEKMKSLPAFEGVELNSANIKGRFGEYPIHVAVIQADIEALQVLLDNNADINLKGEHGYTPLHEAIEQGNEDIIRLLLNYGADVTQKNSDGLSTLEFADEVASSNIVQLLRDQ